MTPEEYRNRVQALLPALRERAPETERLRRLPDETFKEFQEAGLFRALQPGRYGGYELDPGVFFQAGVDIGTVCGSSAWVLTVVGIHNWQLGLFHPQAQEDVWHDDASIQISSSLAPTGTVERVDGGFRLHGRWSFSSGCDHCQWVVLGGVVPPAKEQASTPPDVRSFLVPRSDYTIDDNWQVMGLCGTGSKDIVVETAFVPEYRTHSYLDAFYLRNPGAAVNTHPIFRLPFGVMFPYALAAPAIGVAFGALQLFREQTRARVFRDGARVMEDPLVQFRLAEAAADVDAAHARMLSNFEVMLRLASNDQEIPLESRARYRWDAARATMWSVQAVDRLFEASGGRAIFAHNPIQRAWRDVHAMRAHAGNNPDRAAMIYGRSEFDLPPLELRF